MLSKVCKCKVGTTLHVEYTRYYSIRWSKLVSLLILNIRLNSTLEKEISGNELLNSPIHVNNEEIWLTNELTHPDFIVKKNDNNNPNLLDIQKIA